MTNLHWWEPLRTRRAAWTSQSLGRQPRARAGLDDEIHLLQETTASRLGEAALLSDAQKPTQRAEDNEEMEEYVPNKRTR